MKKYIITVLGFLLICLSSNLQAQASASEWRLVKRTWAMVGDALERYEYKYDGIGRITELKIIAESV